MNKFLSYILGFAFGDGNISKSSYLVRLYDQNHQFVRTTLRSRFIRSFGLEPTITFDKYNNSYVLYKSSKAVWERLHGLGLPSGRKARRIVVPQSINSGPTAIKSEFVSGVFDAEASRTSFTEHDRHPRGYRYIEVKMYSPKFIDGLCNLVVDIADEFKPKVYHYDYGSILRLNGKEQLKLVSSRLHLMHPRFSPPAR